MAKTSLKKKRKTGVKKGSVKPISPKVVDGKLEAVDLTEAFIHEFILNGGNSAKAARKVCPNISVKNSYATGYRLMGQARKRGLIRKMMEKKGYNLSSMVDVAVEKMEKSKKPDWWDRLMKMAEYEDFTKTAGSGGANINVSVFGAHNKIAEDYIEGEIVTDEGEKSEN